MARPHQLIHREKRIEFKITTLEKKLILKNAQSCNMTLSEFCRQRTMHLTMLSRLTDDEKDIYHQLGEYKVHFSRISNLIKNRDPKLNGEIRALVTELQNHLNKIAK